MLKRFLAIGFSVVLLTPLGAEPPRTLEIHAALRQQEKARSEIMRTMHYLTDVYGPRLTGSPQAKAAVEWAIKTMAGWGFDNAHLEPWEFGHPGWTNDHVTARVVAPVKAQLTVEVLAWSPGTKGTVTAPAFQLMVPDRPTPADLTAYFDSIRTQVKGKIVLAGGAVAVAPRLDPRPTRTDDARLRTRYDPNRAPDQGRQRCRRCRARRSIDASTNFCSRMALRFASTTPDVSSDRSWRSTIRPTTSRKWCRQS